MCVQNLRNKGSAFTKLSTGVEHFSTVISDSFLGLVSPGLGFSEILQALEMVTRESSEFHL